MLQSKAQEAARNSFLGFFCGAIAKHRPVTGLMKDIYRRAEILVKKKRDDVKAAPIFRKEVHLL
jgi:hypothetical protein